MISTLKFKTMLRYPVLILLLTLSGIALPQGTFNRYFSDKTLRMDYIREGNSNSSQLFLKQFREEPYWGGSKVNLIDTFEYGNYMLEVFDSASMQLIYSRGYNSLFQEWQTTDQARNMQKTFYESVIMPFPNNAVKIVLEERNNKQQFESKFETYINPVNPYINRDRPPGYKTQQIVHSGDPSQKVDIVFLPDGYTIEEMPKFIEDVKRFAGYMFNWSPYNELSGKFNIWAVEAPSQESGTDSPLKNTWKNTILNTGFYTFGIERYLTTEDFKTVRDIAACVPYDQICILVNSDEYGGGGIFNFCSSFTATNSFSEYLFLHEFGHGFAGLADEYSSSEVAYINYYNIFTEPYEPNITTLVDFKSKWKDMVGKKTPVPTPPDSIYFNKIGAFEGAGYMTKGVYRPAWDCSMRSVSFNNFCPVCRRAIRRMVTFYTK